MELDEKSNNTSFDPNAERLFRDKISTVDNTGKRKWIYPKIPKGNFHTARNLVSLILLFILIAGPFIKINGHPFLLLDFLNRKFYIFGIPFWPQDLHIFVIALITLLVFIILFTAVFGRIFCGWVCPQTIFMESVFRKIEQWIEGVPNSQRRLNAAPWTSSKVLKKGIKIIIFFTIAFIIGNVLLAYIIGKDLLFLIISEPISQHIGGFATMMIFSILIFANFMFFREQACTLVCPYGRLQGVLLDQNSIVVHYDFSRGEPRGKGRRNAESKLGDCIDCDHCVDVCPTGIDIRNGTQLECVNCTACIDSCNAIMDKINLKHGLIRYASYNSIAGEQKHVFNPRVIGYAAVFILLTSTLSIMIASRKPIETTILRTPGELYQEVIEGQITNMYNIKTVNKSYEERNITLRLVEPRVGEIRIINELRLASNQLNESVFFIDIPKQAISDSKIPIEIEVLSNGQIIDTYKLKFIAPIAISRDEKT